MEVLVLIGVIALLFWLLKGQSPSAKGARGEAKVHAALRAKLDPNTHLVLADVTLPTPGGTTQIDNLILSRHGIFVIETKNMSGWIYGGEDQRMWTQSFPREKHRFMNPVHQNYKHIKTVQDLLGVKRSEVFGAVAFVGSAEPQTDMPDGVFWSINALVAHIRFRNAVIFDAPRLHALKAQLEAARLTQGRETDRAHVSHVQQIKSETKRRRSDASACPRCGSDLVKRTNKSNGDTFLGCSRFPKCRGTR